MPGNSKPRKAYRPKPVRLDTIDLAIESTRLLAAHDQYLIDLKIKNHAALEKLVKGQADKRDLTTLLAMLNTTEAMLRLGKGREYAEVVATAEVEFKKICEVWLRQKKAVLQYQQIRAMQELIELHDQQLEISTVADMEKAIKLIRQRPAITVKLESTCIALP